MGINYELAGGRFFVEALPVGNERFELPGAEAAHAGGSRRLVIGDSIILFDGSGWDVKGEIVAVEKRRLVVRPVSREFAGAPLPVPVTCATALPKGAREDMLVSKCAELGMTRLVPVEFERSVVKASVHWSKRRERYRRLAIEAAKQSGASTVMELGEPVDFATLARTQTKGLRLIGVPTATAGVIDAIEKAWPFESMLYAVGPEGGTTDEEEKQAIEAGFTAVKIARTVLRVETAALSIAAVAAAFLSTRAPK